MKICVFSSSSNAIPDIYFKEGRDLGRLIGESGYTLVNGGANVGLMETVTVAASEAGAKTIGIIPERFAERELASENSHELITTVDMMERKASCGRCRMHLLLCLEDLERWRKYWKF